VYVIKPKDNKKKKLRVLFLIGEGAMINDRYETLAGIYDAFAPRWNCALVFTEARSAIHAHYPAPLDDFQASYQWMLDNGDSLGLNTENVVLYGDSGGGYTVMSFAFRCKRLGFTPKGCMACEPILNDMMVYPSSRIVTGCWDALDVLRTFKMCIQPADQFSPFVGPEVVPSHATVEDCVGMCPMYLHTMEMDSDRDPLMLLAGKLYEAKVFTQVHVWGGAAHGGLLLSAPDAPIRVAYEAVRDAEIQDMFAFDLRRPWTVEE
jgi:acetyl esterase